MEQLLELQKALLERIAEGGLETRALSTLSCNSHSCNGAVAQQAEMLEAALRAERK